MKRLLFLFTIVWIAISSVNAQQKWVIESQYLSQPDTVYTFIPKTYDAEKSYPVVYLLHGYSENSNQWSRTIDCGSLADTYDMIIICPDGFVSFYVNSRYDEKSQYESFFFQELVPKVEKSFSIDTDNIFISGLSMGGYGALRFLITYPDYFNTAGSTSGALEIDFQESQKMSQLFWGNNRLNDDLQKLFGYSNTNDWNKESVANLLREKPEFNKPFIFDCGTEDILYPVTLEFKTVADSLNIPTTFISQPGNHNTAYWNKSIEHHFIYFKQHLK